MTALGYLYVIAVLGAGTYMAVRHPRRALMWAVALLPWIGLDMDVGLRVTAFHLFMLPLVATFVIRGIPVSAATSNRVMPLFLFVSYALAVSFIMLPFLPDLEVAGGVLRGPGARSLIQVILLLFTIAPLLIAAHLIQTQELLGQLARTYLTSSLLLATIGYVQMGVWYATGENPLPIAYFHTLMTGETGQHRSGLFALDDIVVFRMNSFGGEPKHLGQALAVALLILVWSLNARVRRFTTMMGSKAIYLLLAIFLTQSTSAFILLATGVLAILVLNAVAQKRLPMGRVLLVMAAVALGGFAVATYWLGLPVADLLVARTADRFHLDDFDAAVAGYLADHWIAALLGVGLGNVHLFADPYLSPRVALFAGGTSFAAKMGLLRIVSEAGVIGGLLFLWFVSRVSLPALQDERGFSIALLAIAFLAFFLVGHASIFYIFAGAIIGVGSAWQRTAGAAVLRAKLA